MTDAKATTYCIPATYHATILRTPAWGSTSRRDTDSLSIPPVLLLSEDGYSPGSSVHVAACRCSSTAPLLFQLSEQLTYHCSVLHSLLNSSVARISATHRNFIHLTNRVSSSRQGPVAKWPDMYGNAFSKFRLIIVRGMFAM